MMYEQNVDGREFRRAAGTIFHVSLVVGLAMAVGVPSSVLAGVSESGRRVPVAYRADVVVVGGGTGAVAAAVAAAESGAKVFLAAPYPYLGEDITATLRLWLEGGETPVALLARRIFNDALRDSGAARPPMPRPMHVKKTLDDALLAAGVTYLYSCYATDVLRDGAGNVCGIVMANRAGRQAVVAKVVIDATEEGTVARLAGAAFRREPGAEKAAETGRTFRRTVIGGEPVEGVGITHRVIEPPFLGRLSKSARPVGREFRVIEYTVRLPLDGCVFNGRRFDSPFAAMAAADQAARRMTYHPDQQFTSDALFFLPDEQIVGQESLAAPWSGVETFSLDAFRPRGVPRVFVAGPAADVPHEVADRLARPLARIDLGARLGRVAADEARAISSPEGVYVPGNRAGATIAKGDVAEVLTGVRPSEILETVPQPARDLPVLGRYEVVVIGGGTSGAPAGIAAARAGAKTLVVEYLHGLGGVGTMGAITRYYHGNRVGFTKQVGGGSEWRIEPKMEWYGRELEKAGADVWFGAIGCGAFVERSKGGNRVRGAVVATLHGRGVVLAKVVIDATGNADVAAAAGAECQYIDATEFAIQGTGLPPRQLGAAYANTDFTYSDETNLVDVWRMFVHGKDKYPDAFDQGKLIDTRERRRVVGDATITIVDQLNRRTYPDSIVLARSNFDTHGYTIDRYFLLEHPGLASIDAYVPYGCLLPRGVDGLLVVGIGMSVHRDALPVTRMQPDIQNQGYAAGRAAAMAIADDVSLRRIDIRKLQEHLVEIGNLPRSVLTDKDSYPLPRDKVANAVMAIRDGKKAAAVVLSHPEEALPLLKEAHRKARHDGHPSEPAYAKFLCVLGDGEAVDTIIDAVKKQPQWDKGWNFKGMGQFGSALSRLDTLIMILGLAGQKKAVPVIVEKLDLLTADDDFSHHRAVGFALERIGDPGAAEALAGLLGKPGMCGYAQTSIHRVRELDPSTDAGEGDDAVVARRLSLRELLLARALLRCGDREGLGRRILTQYTQDLRGPLARHAGAVLRLIPEQESPPSSAANHNARGPNDG